LAIDNQMYQRHSIRLKDYDYSLEGAYFVTTCANGYKCLFGEIENGKMCLNRFGSIVNEFWVEIPAHFTNVVIDTFVAMPNHLHAIVTIVNDRRGEVTSPTQKGAETAPLRKHTLGQIIAYFKYQTTKSINKIRLTPGNRIWQRNYYEHVIRNENDLNEVRQYVIDNPVQWDMDENNPNQQPICNDERNPQGEPICLTK
jgi:putative transposase